MFLNYSVQVDFHSALHFCKSFKKCCWGLCANLPSVIILILSELFTFCTQLHRFMGTQCAWIRVRGCSGLGWVHEWSTTDVVHVWCLNSGTHNIKISISVQVEALF